MNRQVKEKSSFEKSLNLPFEERLICFVIVLLIVGTPTVFSRSIFYSFYLPQLTIFWLLGFLTFLLFIYKVLSTGKIRKPPFLFYISLSIFVFSLFLVSILSEQTWVSLTGLNARGAGAISYFLCVVILISIFQLGQRNNLQIFIRVLTITHVLVAGYALLQKFDLDPITWGSEAELVGTQVFSTLGNSNFSAGYLVSTFPLLVWLAFSASVKTVVRTLAGTCIGISSLALVYFDSAQGDLAVLISLAPLIYWIFSHYDKGFVLALVSSIPIVLVCLLPLGMGQNELRFPLFWIFLTAASAYFGDYLDRKFAPSHFSVKEIKRNFWIVSSSVSFLVFAVFVFFLREKIVNEFKSGLDQRLEYWKATMEIFVSNPLFGTGLETFGFHFTMNRSIEHAVNFSGVLTDSPHSVHLGFLSNGGLLLSCAYVAVLLGVASFGVKAIRKTESLEMKGFYIAVFSAWVAYQLQSIVSIATPGLIYVQWVLGGVLLSGGVSDKLMKEIFKTSKKPSGKFDVFFKYKKSFLSVLGVASFVVLLGPITAPIRANALAFDAQGEFNVGNYSQAKENLVKATKLQPKFPSYFTMLAVVHENQIKPIEAFEGFERAAELSPGNTSPAIEAAHSAIRVGKLNRAKYWYEKSLLADPHNPSVILESVGFFASNNQPERAMELLSYFESLESPQVGNWAYAAKVYDFYEENSLAKHARLCATGGQEGCGTLDAIIYLDKGAFGQAIEEFKKEILENGESLYLLRSIAEAYESSGETSEAKNWFLKSLQLEPTNSALLIRSAEFFASVGELETVYELLERFDSLQSIKALEWNSVFNLYEKIGEPERSADSFLCKFSDQDGYVMSEYQLQIYLDETYC